MELAVLKWAVVSVGLARLNGVVGTDWLDLQWEVVPKLSMCE